jgi:hypothetical protein
MEFFFRKQKIACPFVRFPFHLFLLAFQIDKYVVFFVQMKKHVGNFVEETEPEDIRFQIPIAHLNQWGASYLSRNPENGTIGKSGHIYELNSSTGEKILDTAEIDSLLQSELFEFR